MTTFKTYHGTHRGTFLGVAPTGRNIRGETVDAMRVHNGNITEHWGVANLFSLMQQLSAWRPATQSLTSSPSSANLAEPAFPERSAGGNCTMTTQGLKMSDNVRQIPLGSGLRKVERSEGEAFDVAGVRFTWKVKGEDTGYAFSMYEQKLEPDEGVPLHCHAYGEVFYALSGNVDFLRLTDAGEEWITCAVGETIIVPINAPHAFYNRTEKPARLLSISTQLHQAFFDAVGEADRADPLASMPRPQAMARIGEVAQRFDMHFFPFSPPSPRR